MQKYSQSGISVCVCVCVSECVWSHQHMVMSNSATLVVTQEGLLNQQVMQDVTS